MARGECDGECDRCDCKWSEIGAHEFDDDGCCINCGFDGAEWYWLKMIAYEEGAASNSKMPVCTAQRSAD